jgi:hypothetical protein
VAQSTQSTAKLQLDRLLGIAPTLSSRTTTHCRATEDEKGGSESFGLIVEVSISEEPGAGKSCAQICAGTVG